MTTWRSDLVWGAVAAAAIGYEAYVIRRGTLEATLSRTVRRYARTHEPLGKAAFAIGWGWFAIWFMRHILELGKDADPGT